MSKARVRRARSGDVLDLVELSREIWGTLEGWKAPELLHHQELFPEGQLVAVDPASKTVIGMAVSLIIDGDAFEPDAPWEEVTGHGRLDTHTPAGTILYAAGVAVHPRAQGMGVGTALYHARERLLRRRELEAIRAGARIPGYGEVADRLSAEAYVRAVAAGDRYDPTLSFQIRRGFRVIGIARGYLEVDEASLGHAAIVEWRPPPLPSHDPDPDPPKESP
jgi:ribosomal protein S18 acetylase RimI-like enzyme